MNRGSGRDNGRDQNGGGRGRSPPRRGDGGGGRRRGNGDVARAESPEFMPRGVDTVLEVEKLTRNVSSDHLWEVFGRYGRVRSVDLARDERVGLPLGRAQVTFYKTRDAEDAVAYLDGGQLDGNVIEVSFLLQRRPEAREAGGEGSLVPWEGYGAGGRRSRSRSRGDRRGGRERDAGDERRGGGHREESERL